MEFEYSKVVWMLNGSVCILNAIQNLNETVLVLVLVLVLVPFLNGWHHSYMSQLGKTSCED